MNHKPIFRTKKVTNWTSDNELEDAAIGGDTSNVKLDRSIIQNKLDLDMPLRKGQGDELISQSGEEVDSLLDNINETTIGNTKTRKTRYSSNKLNMTTS